MAHQRLVTGPLRRRRGGEVTKRQTTAVSPKEFQIYPELSPEEFAALKLSIATNGIIVPVEVDDDGNIVDGHHRVRAWNELRAEESRSLNTSERFARTRMTTRNWNRPFASTNSVATSPPINVRRSSRSYGSGVGAPDESPMSSTWVNPPSVGTFQLSQMGQLKPSRVSRQATTRPSAPDRRRILYEGRATGPGGHQGTRRRKHAISTDKGRTLGEARQGPSGAPEWSTDRRGILRWNVDR